MPGLHRSARILAGETVVLTRPNVYPEPVSMETHTSRRKIVPAAEVIDLLEVTHAPERIEEYRQAMQRGDRFPPIAVLRVAGRYFVADGHKRLSAMKALGADEVEIEIWSGRRWISDQFSQFRHKTGQQLSILGRMPFDHAARRQAYRLFWDTVGHWRRVIASIPALLRRRAPR